MASPGSPRIGIRLDADRLDFERCRRGLTYTELAVLSGISTAQLSRARHGQPVRRDTLRRLTAALVGVPPIEGVDLIISEPKPLASLGEPA